MALKASPVGSTPTLVKTWSRPCVSSASPNTNGLEIDWIVNSFWQSPTVNVCPSLVTTQMPNESGSALASSGM
jgi:hypothetical protein